MLDANEAPWTRERASLRVGGACAIAGALVSVAGGAGGASAAYGATAGEILGMLADRPDWYWPLVHLCFITGALLWVAALVALSDSLTRGSSWLLGRLTVAIGVVGAAVHAVDSLLNLGLIPLADAWATQGGNPAGVLNSTSLLLHVLDGGWAGVVTFFHGAPFVLAGLAVAFSRTYPAWLGAIAAFGGTGSVLLGLGMFPGLKVSPEGLFVPFAVLVSLWMIVMGGLMWRRGNQVPTMTYATAPT